MKQITGWSDVTLKRYSEYNKLVEEYQKNIEDLSPENEMDAHKIILTEAQFKYDALCCLTGEEKKEVYNKDVGFIKDYFSKLDFLNNKPEEKKLEKFTFKGVEYKLYENMMLNTKYGQYVESVQAEMAWKSRDEHSLMYLAHQLAHQIDNGKEWSGEERDKLAIEFEDVTMDVFFDFGFFLQSQSEIYMQAYLNQSKKEILKSLPFTKRVMLGWDNLKQYMSWQKLEYLNSLIKLRLIVFYTRTRERFLVIWDTLRQKVITNI
ncbi:hypothetical protein [uncultured Mediterranean phage uvMED]|nr:hypothetical protein [uncultured Mediterranean phage uvMED]